MTCARGDHRAPREGGSCTCGLVTYVPAPKPDTDTCPTCGTPEPAEEKPR